MTRFHLPRPTVQTIGLFAVSLAASAAFALVAQAVRVPAVDALDAQIELAVHAHLDSPIGDAWATVSSFIGSNLVLIPAIVVVGALALHARRYEAAVVLAVDAIVVIAGDVLLKDIFERSRPHLFEKIAPLTDYSFPSGHAMSAVGVWGVLAAVLAALYPLHRGALVAGAVLLVGSIGLSRVYFGVHWPFDVLGGFLAGTPPLLASIALLHAPSRKVVAA